MDLLGNYFADRVSTHFTLRFLDIWFQCHFFLLTLERDFFCSAAFAMVQWIAGFTDPSRQFKSLLLVYFRDTCRSKRAL